MPPVSRQPPLVAKNLRCPACHRVTVIQRNKGHNRATGHIKTMWCWYCQRDQPFREE